MQNISIMIFIVYVIAPFRISMFQWNYNYQCTTENVASASQVVSFSVSPPSITYSELKVKVTLKP